MGDEDNGRWRLSASQQRFLAGHGYGIKDLIGNGAFGQVYRVWDNTKERFLACKVAFGSDRQAILRREAALQRSITHPLFVRYVDCLESREYTFLLTECVEGENLGQHLQKGPLTQEQAVIVTMQLAQGIRHLHEMPQSILYRDLKPENICLTEDGGVRLIDLGCACTIAEARLSKAGSPGYGPWEQLNAINPGLYSDVYALGRILHYMLTGDNPCKPPIQKPPIRVYNRKLSPLLEQFIIQCVEEQPRLRLPDMDSVLRGLRPLMAEGVVGKMALKRQELGIVVGSLFSDNMERGFVYEKNVCCEAAREGDAKRAIANGDSPCLD